MTGSALPPDHSARLDGAWPCTASYSSTSRLIAGVIAVRLAENARMVAGDTPSISAGVSVGGSSIQSDILANHVDYIDPSAVPEFPTPDTSIFAKYATTAYVAA